MTLVGRRATLDVMARAQPGFVLHVTDDAGTTIAVLMDADDGRELCEAGLRLCEPKAEWIQDAVRTA